MSNKKPKDPSRLVRMLAERSEKVVTKLTPIQAEDRRQVVLDVLDDIERLEDEQKQIAAGYKAKIKDLKAALKKTRKEVKDNRVTEELVIQEWLTADNQVLRYRKDTNTQIGDARVARAEELQEQLFPDKSKAKAKAAGVEPELEPADEPQGTDPFPESDITADTFGAQAH
jgi:hypothetical protein